MCDATRRDATQDVRRMSDRFGVCILLGPPRLRLFGWGFPAHVGVHRTHGRQRTGSIDQSSPGARAMTTTTRARIAKKSIASTSRRACPSMGGPARGVANGRWRWRSFRDLVGRPVVRRDEALTRQGSDGRVGVCRLDGRVGARGRVTPDVRIPCPSVRPSVRPSP